MSEPRSLLEISYKQGNTTTPRARWARMMVVQHPWTWAQSPTEKGKKGGKSKNEKGINKGGKFDKKGKPPPPKKFNGECSYCK